VLHEVNPSNLYPWEDTTGEGPHTSEWTNCRREVVEEREEENGKTCAFSCIQSWQKESFSLIQGKELVLITFIVVVVEGWPRRACQILVVVRVPRKAWGWIVEDLILRLYSPFELTIWIGGILMWRSFIVQKEEKKVIEREGLSKSNCDKLIRLVENW
jgi:hypothetical protein